MKFKSENEANTGEGYYSRLFEQGYLKSSLRADIPNPETSYRLYKTVTTKKSEPYIVERTDNGNVSFKMYEFNAIEIEYIKIISDNKAEVSVVYQKTKPPFYNKDYDVGQLKKPDTYTETIIFRKSHTNGWMYCHI